MLSLKEIRELIELVTERGLAGLEIERAGFRLRIEGPRPVGVPVSAAPAQAAPAASPTPSLPPLPLKIAVLIPITFPSKSTKGPPLLPGLMAASV